MRYVLEGEWSGYTSAQRRVVHCEIVPKRRVEALRKLRLIRYTDGTTLIVTVREAKRGERIKEVKSYSSLIREAESAGHWEYIIRPDAA